MNDVQFLNVAEVGIRSLHTQRANSELDELLSINTNVQVGEAQLLTIPLWFIRYKYEGKLYSIVADGASCKVIEGKAPVGKYDVLVVAAIIIAGFLILLFALVFLA